MLLLLLRWKSIALLRFWKRLQIIGMLLVLNGDNQRYGGDKTEQIWRELGNRLRQFVRSRVRSTSDVDDILQDVFLRIHQKLDSLRSTERLESWVFQIARNAAVDHFRKTPASHQPVDDLAAASSKDLDVNTEVSRCIATLIDQLPDDQKKAVSLYELHGVPQAAIAEQESISLSAAKSRIQRGRKNLESLLRECCRLQLDVRGNILEMHRQGDACETDCNCDGS